MFLFNFFIFFISVSIFIQKHFHKKQSITAVSFSLFFFLIKKIKLALVLNKSIEDPKRKCHYPDTSILQKDIFFQFLVLTLGLFDIAEDKSIVMKKN